MTIVNYLLRLFLLLLVLVALVQEVVGRIPVLDLVDRMVRLDVPFPRQESTKIGGKGLAVSTHFGICFVPVYVV